jgi:uncharacterized protein
MVKCGSVGSERMSISSGGVLLAAEVFIPENAVAAVVLVGGSGPMDRSNGGYFSAHRDAFLSHGLGVLWYDKRGVGGSNGDYLAGRLDELAVDARSAHTALSERLGHVPVGLLGHSEGGWVALRAARTRPGSAFVVTTSTPPTTPAVQDRYAVDRWLVGRRLSQPNLSASRALYAELQVMAGADADFDAAAAALHRDAASEFLRPALGRFDRREWEFWKRERDHDPLVDFAALLSPHLAVFGLDDPPLSADESVIGFTQAFVSAHRPRGFADNAYRPGCRPSATSQRANRALGHRSRPDLRLGRAGARDARRSI